MSPPHLHDPSLHLSRRLMRTRHRLRRPVHQTRQTLIRVTAQPPMHSLPSNPIPAGNISHRRPAHDLQHRLIPLLHNTQLHQQRRPPHNCERRMEPGGVTHVPKPLSPTYRSRVPKLSGTYRSRVPKLSGTYRSHSVHHEPKPHITSSHNVSPRSPHSRSTDPPTCAVSPGHSVLTASFATRGSRVQIPSAPRFCLVLVGEILTARCRNDGRAGESAYRASTAVAR
jgi:hypothetical protein